MSIVWTPDGPPPRPNSLLTDDVVASYADMLLERGLRFKRLLDVAALRRSCGVESKGVQVQVNIPPRYRASAAETEDD